MIPMYRLEELAEKVGPDDPDVRSVLETARVFPEFRETAEQILSSMCIAQGFSPMDELDFKLPRNLPTQGHLLGQVLAADRPWNPFHYPLGEEAGNIGVFGVAGTGKSTVFRDLSQWWIEQGVKVIIFDVADEHGALLHRFPADELAVVSARTFPLPLVENPVGSCLDDLARLAQVVGVLRECLFLRDGSCNLLLKVVGDMFWERGVLQGSRDYPLASEVFTELITRKFSAQSRHAGYLETLVNRFQGMLQSFAGLNARRSAPPAQVLKRSLIIRMADLSPGEMDIFSGLFLAWLMCHLQGEIWDSTRVVLGIEEVHLLTSRQKLDRADLGEPLVVRVLRTGRKHGLAVVAVDQVPSELPSGVLGNLASRLVFRLTNAPCIRAVSYSMGLDRAQSSELAELPRRRMVGQTPTVSKPFLLEVAELPEVQRPTWEELAEREKQSLASLDFELADVNVTEVLWGHDGMDKRKKQDEGQLGGDLHKVLARICEKPHEFIEERCQGLELDRSREYRARKALEKLGMIQVGDKLGAKRQLYVPTEKGVQWARNQGLPVYRYKGGIGHERMARDVRRSLGSFSTRVTFVSAGERLGSGGVQPDLVARIRAPDSGDSSRVVVFQICSKNKPAYEAEKAAELLGIEQVDLVIVVAKNKGARDRLTRALRRFFDETAAGGAGIRGDLPAGVRVVEFETCVDAGFDWSWVMR